MKNSRYRIPWIGPMDNVAMVMIPSIPIIVDKKYSNAY
jgi:hypothetical protein